MLPLPRDKRSNHPLIALLVLVLFSPAVRAQEDEFRGVERVVAIGDVHGDFQAFVSLLLDARVIDHKKHWTGGKTHLVQTGDLLDRGADSRKVLDLLMDLEKQAQKAGGRVHVLLGNHEAMNLYGDLRYVSQEEYASFRSNRSQEIRDHVFEQHLKELETQGKTPADAAEYREKWLGEHPLGWVEHRLAFGPEGKYGRWLRGKNAIIRIDDVLFVHGGISPKYATRSIRQINEQVREELRDFTKLQDGVTMDSQGPLWYRGLAQSTEAELENHVQEVLGFHRAKHIVIGHTPTRCAVLARFGGKVVLIDVGLSNYYGGPGACLVITGSQFQALHRGSLLRLPVNGEEAIGYLKAAAALDPQPSPLQPLIEGREVSVGADEQ